jgi:Ni/Fe-hydrogenase 1 B-type cytochrome subunit
VSAMSTRAVAANATVRVYIWELPVRLTHWLIFFTFFILAGTGYYIAHPFITVAGPARDHFAMGLARAVHLYAAIVFTAALLVRVYWMFAGNQYARLTQLLPVSRERVRSFWEALLFYSYVRREAEECAGHNTLAGMSYALVYGVYFGMIATGLALYSVVTSPTSVFASFGFLVPLLGGLQVARLVHHIGMWIVFLFAVMHIYFVILASLMERIGTFDSIISGYKFLSRRNADLP